MQGTINRGDSTTMARSLYSAIHPRGIIIGAIIQAFYFIVEIGSIPARFLVRKNMGERAFSVLSFLFCLLFYCLVGLAVFILFHDWLKHEAFSLKWVNWNTFWYWSIVILINPFSIFIILIIAKGGSHFRVIVHRINAKLVGYSYHRGDSIYQYRRIGSRFLGFTLNEELVRMLVEPLYIIFFSMGIFSLTLCILIFRINADVFQNVHFIIDNTLVGITAASLSCLISALFLMLEEFILQSRFRADLLNLVDGDIEMMRTLKAKNQLQLEEQFALPIKDQSSDSLVVG